MVCSPQADRLLVLSLTGELHKPLEGMLERQDACLDRMCRIHMYPLLLFVGLGASGQTSCGPAI